MNDHRESGSIDPALRGYLAERRREREYRDHTQLEEIDETEFIEETADIVTTILGALAGKPVELQILDFGGDRLPATRVRHRENLFRLEDAPGGWLIWAGEHWVPLSVDQVVWRGSIAYRYGDQEWWAWSFAWDDRLTGWSLSMLDRSRCPADIEAAGLSLFDASPLGA